MNLETASPVEFDTALAAKHDDLYDALMAQDRAWNYVAHHAEEYLGRRGYREAKRTEAEIRDALADAIDVAAAGDPGYDDNAAWRKWYAAGQLVEAYDKYEVACAATDEVRIVIAEFNQMFRARGGWTRAYLAVTNGGGHVHSSMHCGTCYEPRYDRHGNFKPGTRYAWLPELSDHDEAEIITKAGSDACTICYPNAPVNDLKRPRSIFTADERTASQARAEAQAKREAKAAATITLPLRTSRYNAPEDIQVRDITWKTTRALQNDTGAFVREMTGTYAMVNAFDLELMDWKGESGNRVRVPINQEDAKYNLRLMAGALAGRGVDAEALIAKNHKRAVKEGGTNWDGVL